MVGIEAARASFAGRRMTPSPPGRVRPDGKAFSKGGAPFRFRGVTYGTFRPAPDGALFPERERVKLDFASIQDNGFTVVRTYTEPPERVLAAAADWGLQLLVGVFYEDWRYLVGCSVRQRRALERIARRKVPAAARHLLDCEHVLGVCIGNEVPADVVRWLGGRTVARGLGDLVKAVHDVDADQLVTYANYPTTEYLTVPELDFCSYNVFLDDRLAFRRYVTRLQHLCEDRPLVLSEVGSPAGTDPPEERRQAEVVGWQLGTALERGVAGTCLFSWTDDWWVAGESQEAWGFGLTRADRTPKGALDVARRWNERSVADLDFAWPSITVAVCAYNAANTIDECLRHTCALDYPEFEVLVVDDGSTDATRQIVRHHRRARLVEAPHRGLSAARNTAFQHARGELVAYLDSDAYPSADWPYYLALGFDGARVGGVGGPNLPPAGDPPTARSVSASPGGPVHVMLSDDRAEHIPGCNMAFWRDVLVALGGFDPIFTSAGDDVDLAWRLLERDWEIGFHPAAVVWHHPRATTRGYLRQQRGYGRSERLVEARHPARFTPAGGARWRGSIYRPGGSAGARLSRHRIDRGPVGSAAYQSVYRGGSGATDVAHQLGVPAAVVAVATAPLAALAPYDAVPALVGLGALTALFLADAVRCTPPASIRRGRLKFRAHVGLLHLLQPLARIVGRHWRGARQVHTPVTSGRQPAAMSLHRRKVAVARADRPRPQLVAELVDQCRGARVRVLPTTEWEDHDAHVSGSVLVKGELVTSSHPPGWIQIRVRVATRKTVAALLLLVAAVVALSAPMAAAALLLVGAADVARGRRRARRTLRALVAGGAP